MGDCRPMSTPMITNWKKLHASETELVDVGQFESFMVCMVYLCLMFVVDVNYVFDCGLVPGLGPLWSPLCVLDCVLSGRPFPQDQAQV